MLREKKLIQKLEDMRSKFTQVENFAGKVPICADYIINNEIVESDWNKIGDTYKSIYFAWGMRRGVYGNGRSVTNCKLDYEGRTLTKIYINTVSLYDRHDKYGLAGLVDLVFFYDKLNSTFYAADNELEGLLEALNGWYVIAKEKAGDANNKDELENLERKKQHILDRKGEQNGKTDR